MIAKRLSEFRYLKDKAGDYRLSHKKYSRSSLLFGMAASAAICLLAFLYLGARFHLASFYAIAPFLLVFFALILRKTLKTGRGQVRGRIAAEPKGDLGFGYDPVFFYRPWGRTFGEISPARKNTVSHRGRALARMKAFLAGRR